MEAVAAIVLAGGAGRRLGGRDKPAIAVGGVSMLDRVLAALVGSVDAASTVVVGPAGDGVDAENAERKAGDPVARTSAGGIRRVLEDPPGGGPVAGLAAGLDALRLTYEAGVFVLAGDLPLFNQTAAARLIQALDGDPEAASPLRAPHGAVNADLPEAASPLRAAHGVGWDGAIYVDSEGWPQWLCGIWRVTALRDRLGVLAAQRAAQGGLAGASLRKLFEPMQYVTVVSGGDEPPPYWDCDTEEDIRAAERWLQT